MDNEVEELKAKIEKMSKYITELEVLSPEVRINDRIEKFNKMGVWK